MASHSYYGEFGSLEFPKVGRDIVRKATEMIGRIGAKIEERERRIRDAANEAGMKDAGDVLLSLQSIAQGTGAGDINMTVGLAAKVRSEIAELTKERAEVERLRLIVDNLPQDASFSLKFDELRYFGF